MKPNIDINDPKVKQVLEHIHEKTALALDTPQTVEQAILPLFAVPGRKGHEKPKTKPEQIGSGVLVRIKDEFFLFGATHVFEECNGFEVMIGDMERHPIVSLKGERISAGKPGGGQYGYDASVYHIQTSLSTELADMALTGKDIDSMQKQQDDDVFLVAGFRIKKSNTAGQVAKGQREAFTTASLSMVTYKDIAVNPETHLALAYDKQVLVNRRWQLSPTPRGMSGGAMIRIDGVNLRVTSPGNSSAKQLLTAITIEYHQERKPLPGHIVGTKVGVHLGLIDQNFPGLLDGW